MAREQYKRDAQLIICVLSDNDSSVYSSIKMVGDTEISVRTQCIQSKFTNSPKQQYCANVCLKINAKLGGVNAILGPKAIPFISEKPTIVFGADVTHPGANDTTSSSIAAVCASMDRYVAKYHSLIREQNNRVEIIVDLEDMVKQLLQSFYQTTGRKPESILFYRDGVSEGQFPEVQQKEIKEI
jgi:eukaryotic translation initiation factor 2C